MSRSSDLLELPGVIAAGIYSRKGLLEEFEGAFPETDTTGSLCSALRITMEMQCFLLRQLAGKAGWQSCYGEVMWGSERSITIIRDTVCLLDTKQASLNQVISAMRLAVKDEGNSIN